MMPSPSKQTTLPTKTVYDGKGKLISFLYYFNQASRLRSTATHRFSNGSD